MPSNPPGSKSTLRAESSRYRRSKYATSAPPEHPSEKSDEGRPARVQRVSGHASAYRVRVCWSGGSVGSRRVRASAGTAVSALRAPVWVHFPRARASDGPTARAMRIVVCPGDARRDARSLPLVLALGGPPARSRPIDGPSRAALLRYDTPWPHLHNPTQSRGPLQTVLQTKTKPKNLARRMAQTARRSETSETSCDDA